MTEKCVFCGIIAGTAPATIVKRWDDAIAFTPLNPVTLGHVLVVPLEHVPNFTTNPDVTMRTMARAAMLAREMEPAGDWNLITSKGRHATQSVFHLHVHLVPRKMGDQLILPWGGSTSEAETAHPVQRHMPPRRTTARDEGPGSQRHPATS